MLLNCQSTDRAMPRIGDAFGGKDHSTVMYPLSRSERSWRSIHPGLASCKVCAICFNRPAAAAADANFQVRRTAGVEPFDSCPGEARLAVVSSPSICDQIALSRPAAAVVEQAVCLAHTGSIIRIVRIGGAVGRRAAAMPPLGCNREGALASR